MHAHPILDTGKKKKREDKYTKMREKMTTSESEKYVKPKYYRT